jgi:hypothetical protein
MGSLSRTPNRGKKYSTDIPYDVWTTANGHHKQGRRCQAHKAHDPSKQCDNNARKGYAVCAYHGAGKASRTADKTRKDARTAALRTGENAPATAKPLHERIVQNNVVGD